MKKLFTFLFSLLLLCTVSFTVKANDIKVIDEANVLSEEEESSITAKANEFIAKTNYDIVVYYAYDKADDDTIVALADDTFDYNGYGIGTDYNGLIMVVDIYYRTFTITTCGSSCIYTYTDASIDDMYDYVGEYLGDERWADASEAFIYAAEYVFENSDYYHSTGGNSSYDQTPVNKTTADYAKEALVPAGIIALAATFISFFVFYKQLKNTGEKATAGQYCTGSNLNIFRSGEIYLYTNTSRRKIERESPSGGGGSSTHISSSGRSHGGGGSRHF